MNDESEDAPPKAPNPLAGLIYDEIGFVLPAAASGAFAESLGLSGGDPVSEVGDPGGGDSNPDGLGEKDFKASPKLPNPPKALSAEDFAEAVNPLFPNVGFVASNVLAVPVPPFPNADFGGSELEVVVLVAVPKADFKGGAPNAFVVEDVASDFVPNADVPCDANDANPSGEGADPVVLAAESPEIADVPNADEPLDAKAAKPPSEGASAFGAASLELNPPVPCPAKPAKPPMEGALGFAAVAEDPVWPNAGCEPKPVEPNVGVAALAPKPVEPKVGVADLLPKPVEPKAGTAGLEPSPPANAGGRAEGSFVSDGCDEGAPNFEGPLDAKAPNPFAGAMKVEEFVC